MSNSKLTYFNFRGIGEVLRMIMKHSGQRFEDNRISFEKWKKLKSIVPFGQLPVYEEKEEFATQSVAIARYLAKKGQLVGKDEWEDLMIDSVVDTIDDLKLRIVAYYYEQNQEQKARLKSALFKETIPYYFERLEKIAKANDGHMAVGKLTWADFYFASLIDSMCFWTDTNLLEGRPYLVKVKNNVHNLPAIKEWVNKRPKTDF